MCVGGVKFWKKKKKRDPSFCLSPQCSSALLSFVTRRCLLFVVVVFFFSLLLLSSSRTRTTRTRNCLENASKFLYFSISPIISVFSTPKRKTETEKKRKEKPNGLIIEKMKTTVVRPIWARKF